MNGRLLIEAHTLINGERKDDYGDPQKSFRLIASMWSAYTGHEISPADVACMMCLLKIVRESHGHKADNLLDAAGYIGLAADLAENSDIQSELP